MKLDEYVGNNPTNATDPSGLEIAGPHYDPYGIAPPGPPRTPLLGFVVQENCLAPLSFASHRYADFHLLMPLYVCRRWEGIVRAREAQKLAWVRPGRLRDYPMPPADAPLIAHLTALL